MTNTKNCTNHENILITKSPRFVVDQVIDFMEKHYGLIGSLSPLDSERDQNFLLTAKDLDRYVIKISNISTDLSVLEMQLAALKHIEQVNPDLPVSRIISSLNGSDIEIIQSVSGSDHYVHVLTYLPGIYPKKNGSGDTLLRQAGKCLTDLVKALRGFYHPAASYGLLWDIKQALKLKQYLSFIKDPDHLDLVQFFLGRFEKHVLPDLPKLRSQVVHNDFAPNNMLVSEDDPEEIVGIIDFGDLIHTLLVTDLATTIAQYLVNEDDPVRAAGEIITAYHESIPLEPAELVHLYDLIATRLTMLNVIATWRVTLHPENRDYIMGGVDQVWDTLKAWRELDPDKVTNRFLRACGYWEFENVEQFSLASGESYHQHLSRRSELLGPCTYLFYDRPLHIVRGEGVWLFDESGNRYLDVYNNVPHVGHCHPHVVNAIYNQVRKLNTSTRYMHGLILDLADQITDKMPEELSTCMFVCTGSEANELAWRMAKLVTGNNGALITNYSYHGNGNATIRFSSEEVPKDRLPLHVETIHPPESNSTFLKPDAGIRDAINALNDRGHPPAMLILDTGFTSNGIFTPPPRYLKTLAAETRSAGGIFVADEVQAGFGRLGSKFWGFEFDDVIPDIVTMGKPMGNGHPIAAVVTRPEIAETLAKDTGYFNTFGGNPVSCAAGLAVLNVIEKEGLQQNALEVGDYLSDRLREIQNEFPILFESHGSGLLIGNDVLTIDGSPDSRLAERIMNYMRENGVLIGITGPNGNVLKFRPPIVFHKEHVEILLAVLVQALNECC